jgi:hypothetical protein
MKKPLLIFAVAAQLTFTSACNTIPNLSSSSSPKKQDEQTDYEQMLEIKAFTEEWKVMKPALVNLVALESDLQYLLNNIDQNDEKLMNTTQLQSSLETEEQVAAYETMSFAEREDITSDFADKPEELEDLSTVSLFADAALLDKLKASVDEITTNLPPESIGEPTAVSGAETFTAMPTIIHTNPSKGVEIAAITPVAEYLLEKQMKLETRPIPDIRIVGTTINENGSNTINVQNQHRESKLVNAAKFDAAAFRQPDIGEKFIAQQSTADDFSNNGKHVTNHKFSEPNQNNKGKFSNSYAGKLTNPRNIVGTVNQDVAINANPQNLKRANPCTATKSSVGDGYALHLASYSSLDNAIKGWETLSNTFYTQLCGLVALTEQVSVNKKRFFSLRAGGFETKKMADYACANFISKNQYCRSIRFTGERLL